MRHYNYEKKDQRKVEMREIGPRFEMKPYQISLGSVLDKYATKEWVLKPYMNTANKRKQFRDQKI